MVNDPSLAINKGTFYFKEDCRKRHVHFTAGLSMACGLRFEPMRRMEDPVKSVLCNLSTALNVVSRVHAHPQEWANEEGNPPATLLYMKTPEGA